MTTPALSPRDPLDSLDPDVEHAYVDRAVDRLREVTGHDAPGVTYSAGAVWVDADVLMQLLDTAGAAATGTGDPR